MGRGCVYSYQSKESLWRKVIDLLYRYDFWVVAMGTVLLAIASGAVGTITLLKGESLIGDAIGHSTFPGVVLAFMLFMQRDPVLLLLGATVAGSVAFVLIQLIGKQSKLELDSVLAIVLSSFFGLGMVLKSYIQGNPNYAGASQSGLQQYIFGQAAYMMKADLHLIIAVAVPSLFLLILFYKEIKLFLFDETFGRVSGYPSVVLYGILLLMSMSLIATGLKLVGAILISSFFIAPGLAALQWSSRFHHVLFIAGGIGGVSAFVGTYLSSVLRGFSTGPSIIVVMTLLALLSMLIGPRGAFRRGKKRSKVND